MLMLCDQERAKFFVVFVSIWDTMVAGKLKLIGPSAIFMYFYFFKDNGTYMFFKYVNLCTVSYQHAKKTFFASKIQPICNN